MGRGGLVLHLVTEIDFSSSLGRYVYSLELWASGGKKIFCWIYLLLASCALRLSSVLGRRGLCSVGVVLAR